MPDDAAQTKALRDHAAAAVGFGITSEQLMATNRSAADLARSVIAADLPIRLRVIDFPLTGMSGWRQPAGGTVQSSPRVTVSGTKWVLDGTPVERLMLLREPYSDRPSSRGRRNFAPGDVSSFLKHALAAREQPLFHAVGDAAIDMVLSALEQSGGAAWQPLRPRIEHGDMLEQWQFERVKQLGVTIVQNPSHFMLPDLMAARLGGRTARSSMMRSMIGAGVPVALGSDGPTNPYLNMMFASINANNPPQAMSREQAIVAYTLGAARAELLENQKGTLSPGMFADLAILSQDVFKVPAAALPATRSVLTVVGGKIVHEEKK
jgi:predicted amidohydrolase YtcJ